MAVITDLSRNEVNIRRLSAHYHISSRHPAPDKVASKLDALCLHRLPGALECNLSQLSSSGNATDGIWLIKRLEIDVDLDMGRDGDALARRMAGRITRSLTRALAEADDNVLFFPSKLAWKARLILDIARGDAWDRWYYRSFEGIKALPSSAAIRTVLTDKSDSPAMILAELSAAECMEVLCSLGDTEVKRVLDRWISDSTTEVAVGDPLSAVDVLIGVLKGLPSNFSVGPDALALSILAAYSRDAYGQIPRSILVLALGIALVHELAVNGDPELIRNALVNADIGALCNLDPQRTDLWQSLVAMPEQVRRRIAEQSRPLEQRSNRGADVNDERHSRQTPYGGWFFLLPQLEATLPWGSMEDWPALLETPASNLLRWLILAQCSGFKFFPGAMADGFWRDSLGIHPKVSVDLLEDWLNDIEPERWSDLAIKVVKQETNFLGSPMILGVEVGGDALAILANETSGHWVFAQPLREEKLSQVAKRLCRDTLGEYLGDGIRTLKVLGMNAGAKAESEWLDLSEIIKIPGDAALVLTLAAQRVLRKFAGRIPGFARTSFQHLHANVLEVGASIEFEEKRTLVRVARPPLDVMLNMTGINRSKLDLPWWPGPPLEIYPSD